MWYKRPEDFQWQRGHSNSFIINVESFRTLRVLQSFKPTTGRFFWSMEYDTNSKTLWKCHKGPWKWKLLFVNYSNPLHLPVCMFRLERSHKITSIFILKDKIFAIFVVWETWTIKHIYWNNSFGAIIFLQKRLNYERLKLTQYFYINAMTK